MTHPDRSYFAVGIAARSKRFRLWILYYLGPRQTSGELSSEHRLFGVTVHDWRKPVSIATIRGRLNGSNDDCSFFVLDKRVFCESLVTRLSQESFSTTASITGIRGFYGKCPSQSNIFCCVDATDELSKFRRLVEINGTKYCFIVQIHSDDHHRARFIPSQEVLGEPSGKPRMMHRLYKKYLGP